MVVARLVALTLLLSPMVFGQEPESGPADTATMKYLPPDIERKMRDEIAHFERARAEAYRLYVNVLLSPQGVEWLNSELEAKKASSAIQKSQEQAGGFCAQFDGMEYNAKTVRCEKPEPGRISKLLRGRQ